MKIFFAFALLLLSACTTVGDLRRFPIERAEEIMAPAEALSACVHDALLEKITGWEFLPSRSGDAFNITAEPSGGSGLVISWALTFSPAEPDLTHVDLRATKSIWGYPTHPADLWKIVEACA